MTGPRHLVFVACAVMVSSCQTPRSSLPSPAGGIAADAMSPAEFVVALERSWSRQQHVSGLAYELGLRNAELCGADTAKDVGIEWITLADLPKTSPRAAGTMLGVGHLPFVAVATPGSPADQAGIRQGDTIVSVNGMPLPTAAEEYYGYVVVNNVQVPQYRRRIDRALGRATESGRPVEIAIRRDGEGINVSVQPAVVCDYNVLVVEDPVLGMTSHGRSVLISSGLYDFAGSDAAVQAAIAHELAHIMEKHAAGKIRNSTIGGVLGGIAAAAAVAPTAIFLGLAGADVDVGGVVAGAVEGSSRVFAGVGGRMFSTSREREADYLALYLLERSGVDAAEGVGLWTRLPADSPLARSHAGVEERLANMEATAREIGRKRSGQESVVPNDNRKPAVVEP